MNVVEILHLSKISELTLVYVYKHSKSKQCQILAVATIGNFGQTRAVNMQTWENLKQYQMAIFNG